MSSSAPGALVICAPLRSSALPGVCRHLQVAGVLSTGGKLHTKLPVFASLLEALDAGVTQVLLLSPYRGMTAAAGLCQDRGIRFVSAGPVTESQRASTSDLPPYAAGRWRYQPTLTRVAETSQRPAFGCPVFLRHTTGGGKGVLGAWWAVLEGLETITEIIDSPRRLWVTATHSSGRWHATLLATTAQDASAQLVVTPTVVSGEDAMLLGTGGLVWSEGVRDAVVEQAGHASHLLPDDDAWPDGAWAAAALAGDGKALRTGLDKSLPLELLPTLRRAARSGCPELLSTG